MVWTSGLTQATRVKMWFDGEAIIFISALCDAV